MIIMYSLENILDNNKIINIDLFNNFTDFGYETKNLLNIDLAFLVVYTLEGILKVIAMGFVMRSNSYLRDSWNIVSSILIYFYSLYSLISWL